MEETLESSNPKEDVEVKEIGTLPRDVRVAVCKRLWRAELG